LGHELAPCGWFLGHRLALLALMTLILYSIP
jgi:hypothetical protein